MQSAAAFSRAACAEVGCKSLGTLSALADTHSELQAGLDEVKEIQKMIDDAKAEKEHLRRQHEVALEAFEGHKRRCDKARRPVPHAIGREYLRSYDRFQVSEESVARLEHKLSKLKQSPGNPSGFQGHSTLR